MKQSLLIAALLLSFQFIHAQGASEIFFNQTDAFLKKYVQNGRVDYKTIKKNPAELNQLVQALETFDLSGLPEGSSQKAFWINAYNILVIKGIVEKYPVDSPLKIEGFFKTIPRTAARAIATLDDIENKYIREAYGDARIHFALVCAARGCPPLASEAYRPETLDEQLELCAKKSLNDDRFIRVDVAQKEVLLSEIFNWFKTDFEKGGKTILEFINQYRAELIPLNFAIGYYEYDWKLNEK